MEDREEHVDADESPNQEKKRWFDKWAEYIEKSVYWDETSYGYAMFPYLYW